MVSRKIFFIGRIFPALQRTGRFKLAIEQNGKEYNSFDFEIGNGALAAETVPVIIQFYQHQRANSPEELKADQHILLYGSTNRIDLRGGWCDASGDVSKYFSHLAYANFMSPQQTPLVVWSMVNVVDTCPALLDSLKAKTALMDEAIYGADYVLRSLSPQGYFYMTVFSYFKKDPEARRVVGLLANSKTTSDYQCAFREGGGMAIAALGRAFRDGRRTGNFHRASILRARSAHSRICRSTIRNTMTTEKRTSLTITAR